MVKLREEVCADNEPIVSTKPVKRRSKKHSDQAGTTVKKAQEAPAMDSVSVDSKVSSNDQRKSAIALPHAQEGNAGESKKARKPRKEKVPKATANGNAIKADKVELDGKLSQSITTDVPATESAESAATRRKRSRKSRKGKATTAEMPTVEPEADKSALLNDESATNDVEGATATTIIAPFKKTKKPKKKIVVEVDSDDSEVDTHVSPSIALTTTEDMRVEETAPMPPTPRVYATPTDAQLHTVQIAAGQLTAQPISFTADSEYAKHFITAVGPSIKVYRVKTGEVVRTLDANAEGTSCAIVVAAVLNPRNRFQLYAFHADGMVHLWEFQDAVVLKSWKLACKKLVSAKLAPQTATTGTSSFFVCQEAITDAKTGEEKSRMVSVLLSTTDDGDVVPDGETNSSDVTLTPNDFLPEIMCPDALYDISCDGRMLAYSPDARRIQLYDLEQGCFIQWFVHDRDLTVLKFHPLAAAHLASGDARGQIFLWHLDTPSTTGRTAAQHRPRFTKLHWHAFPVRSLGFSPDGTALISGGNEAVLVVWQLQTGKPRFRPRLGARLVQVMQSPDSRHYLVASDDNTIHLVSAVDFELEQSVFGLKSVTALVKATAGRPPVMFVCQADGVVGVQAAPGSLQLWNAASNRMLVEIDVAERPRLQCTDAGDVVGAVVLFAAMSKDGQWLATVDQRVMKTGVASGAAASGNGKFSVDAEPDHLATVTERHLKFWRKTTAGGYGFQLVTRINHPHKGDVTSLAFYPRTLQAAGNDGEQMTTHLCATSSSDGTFKVWQTAPAPPEYANTNDRTVALKAMPGKKNGKKALPAPMAASTPIALPPTWICRSTAYWRNLPASSLDFSADGSVLAVAYKNVITLWHPLTATLYRVLALAPSTIVTGVYWFGCKTKNRSRSRYLAALSSAKNSGEQCTLAVWDVVRGAVCWSRAIDDSHPLTFMDKTAGVLAIASRDTGAAAEPSWTLETFEPESSTPTLVQLFAGIVHGVGITPGDSRPKHFRAQQYIVLNGDNNLVVMEKPREDATVEATPATAGQDAAAVKWTNMLALSSSSPNLLSSILPSASAGSKAQKKAIATANAAPAPEPFDAKRRQAMLDAPSHVLPTLSGFFDLFMEKMLIGARDDTTAADNAADTSTTPVDLSQSEAMDMDQPPAMAPVAHNWSWMKSFA